MIPKGQRRKVEVRMMPGIRGRIVRVGERTGECIGEAEQFRHTRACNVRLILQLFVRLNECWWATWCERVLCVLPCDGRPRVRKLHRKFPTDQTPPLGLLPAQVSLVTCPGLSGDRLQICEPGI